MWQGGGRYCGHERPRVGDLLARGAEQGAGAACRCIAQSAFTDFDSLLRWLSMAVSVSTQELAHLHSKPLALVHHLEAHCLISRIALEQRQEVLDFQDEGPRSPIAKANILPHCRPKVDFPFLTFLASGGHTSLLLCHDLGEAVLLA